MEEKVYEKPPLANPAMEPSFYPIITHEGYGLYLANRHNNWRKHTRKFKTNNRSDKHF